MDKTRFTFASHIPMREVEGTLQLARLATASLHGDGRVELDAFCTVNSRTRWVEIDAVSDAGHTLALVFFGFIKREFGEGAVQVARLKSWVVRQNGGAA